MSVLSLGSQHLSPQSAEDVHEIFQRLGYDVYDPEPFEGDDLDQLDLDDLDRAAVNRAYIVAQRDMHTVYLYEVDDLRQTRLRGLAWHALQRGTALLVVTRDYREVLFVDPRFVGRPNKSSVRVNKLRLISSDPTRHDLDTLNAIHAHRRSGQQIYDAQGLAFNVTTITKKFYEEYRRHYERTREAVRQYNPGVREFHDTDQTVKLHAFTQRLLGRLMFLYFLQRKGWLGERQKFLTEKYMETMRRHAHELHGDGETFHYYREVLEPLFFQTMNTRRPGDITQWTGIRIPYLNGGLFDESRDPDGPIILPDSLFDPNSSDGLLAFFNRYNFTIADDTPLEQDVAVDPEMLGKVFENMLEERDRGQSGSFYTPRTIVAYMCQEALAGYLEESAGIPRETTRIQFDPDADVHYTAEEAERVSAALDTLTVLDPAVGSGSFLIGMMNEIIRLRKKCYFALTLNPSPDHANAQGEGPEGTYRQMATDAMVHIARDLRQRETSAEDILWECLRDRRLANLKFRRQHPIANTAYVVDFFCYEHRLAVELDGEIHREQQTADNQRQHALESLGLRVIRFTNKAIFSDLESALVTITQTALASPLPVPQERSGEGPGVRAEIVANWKESIIRSTLYGVDIKPEAIEIAQLRLWLALVVDQTLDQARPLPNLDYRLMAGNSLIETIDGEPVLGKSAAAMMGAEVAPAQPSLGLFETDKERFRLDELRAQFFDATPAERRKLRADISAQERRIVAASLQEKADAQEQIISRMGRMAAQTGGKLKASDTRKLNAAVEKLARLTRLQEDMAKPDYALPFFLYRLHFSEVFEGKGGFDVVVANPPYVRYQAIPNAMKDVLQADYPDFYNGFADLYVYFFAKSIDLVKSDGTLIFITSNKYFRAAYGKKLRIYLKKNLEIERLIDFGDLDVFDATAYPTVIQLKKSKPSGNNLQVLSENILDNLSVLSQRVTLNSFEIEQADLNDDGWNFAGHEARRVLAKMKGGSDTLQNIIDDGFYTGLNTGLNDAYVITPDKKKELLSGQQQSADLIKSWIRGRHVKRWKLEWEEGYVIVAAIGVNLDSHPSFKSHFLKYKDALEKRSDYKPNRMEWYHLRSCNYYDKFEGGKILYPDIAEKPQFVLDETGAYADFSAFFIPSNDRYLLGVLNSDAVEFFLKQISSVIRGGYLRFKRLYMRRIPIPDPPADLRQQIASLAQQCLDAAKDDPGRLPALEAELNRLVYQAYGLDEEDIAVIEGALGDTTQKTGMYDDALG